MIATKPETHDRALALVKAEIAKFKAEILKWVVVGAMVVVRRVLAH